MVPFKVCLFAGSNGTTGKSSQTVGDGQSCKGSEADAKNECRRIGCEVVDPISLYLMSKMNCVFKNAHTQLVCILKNAIYTSCVCHLEQSLKFAATYCHACNRTCRGRWIRGNLLPYRYLPLACNGRSGSTHRHAGLQSKISQRNTTSLKIR